MAIELARGLGRGHDRRMQLLDPVARVVDHLLDQQPAEPAAARRGAHIDAPQHALVAFVLQRRHREAGRADQRAVEERAERGALLEPVGHLRQAAADLLLEGGREGARVDAQRLQPAGLEGGRVGAAK
jgi:hypothetical protein